MTAMMPGLRKRHGYRLHFAVQVARTVLFPVRAVRTRRMLVRVISGLALGDGGAREVVALLCEALADGDVRDGVWVHTLVKLLEDTGYQPPCARDLLDPARRAGGRP
jgi:hypothetical protein